MNKLWAKAAAAVTVIAAPAVASAQVKLPSPNTLGGLLTPIDPGNNRFDLFALFGTVLNYIIVIAGVLAILYLLWAGIQYITAGADDDKAKNAKKAIFNAIIGIIVIILSWVIISWVSGFVRTIVPNGSNNNGTILNPNVVPEAPAL